MKTFNASDMTHNRTAILEAAKEDGAIIQKKNTNGVVLEQFYIVSSKICAEIKIEPVPDVLIAFKKII